MRPQDEAQAIAPHPHSVGAKKGAYKCVYLGNCYTRLSPVHW